MDVNYSLPTLSAELQVKILFDSGFSVKDVAICNKVCKAFNEMSSSPAANKFWETAARKLLPETNWDKVKEENPLYSLRICVIRYKKGESSIERMINEFHKDSVLLKILKQNLYHYLTPFLNSENHKIQYAIGFAYHHGSGIARNPEAGLKYVQMAADQNYGPALQTMGDSYISGKVRQKDLNKAFEYYERAANQGWGRAQQSLANCYAKGMGCQPDLRKAFEYYERATNQGLREAELDLAKCYENGKGCQPDPRKAFEYYERAANKGLKEAQFQLGNCYLKGIGCQPDSKKASEFYEKAAKQGLPEATQILSLLGFSSSNPSSSSRDQTTGEPPQKRQRQQ